MAAEGEKKGAVMEPEKGEDVAPAWKNRKEEAGGKMVILRSSTAEKRYEIPEAAARRSVVIGHMLDGGSANGDGVVLHIAARTLDTVVEYCIKHADSNAAVAAAATKSDPNTTAEAGSGGGGVNTAASENLEDWDRELVDRLSTDDLYDLLHAANFLEIKGLLDVVYQKVADMIKGKSTDEIRATFNIANDFTTEEEDELREQYAWIFNE